MTILAIGISVYDSIITLNEKFQIDSKIRIQNQYDFLGGQASTAACVCGKFGLETYMISKVGNDEKGSHILNAFKCMNVHTNYMQVIDTYKTSYSLILNHQDIGKRTILNYQDTPIFPSYSLPKSIDFLLLDAHEEQIGLQALQTFTNIPSMLDAERVNELTLKYAKEVDYLVCSEKFARDYTKLDIIPENYQKILYKLKELNQKYVVVTLGENGLIYEYNNEIKQMFAYKNEVIDSTGAGDIFHGALAYALHEHFNYEKALWFATITASLSLSNYGGSSSIPTLENVYTIFNNTKEETITFPLSL